jgi:MEDS: MEthanogen/methylotroph, DcmR Sensory domain
MFMTTTPTWESLFRAPHPCDHFVQLYTDDGFLARGVAQFVGRGLADGEGAIIIATPEHVALFADAFGERGVDVADTVRRGQLVLADAEDCLAKFMVDGMPDRGAFLGILTRLVEGVRAAGYPKLRLYGEMVDLLWRENLDATVQLEELWNEALTAQRVSLLCAYRIDNFDRYAHRAVLPEITRAHSHLIPVDDYDRLERAVDCAYAEVFGADGESDAFRALLLSGGAASAVMPHAQAALLALRGISGRTADAVLERARHHYRYRA